MSLPRGAFAEVSRPIRPPAHRPRILHIFRAPVGGLFRHVLDLARAQIARGLDVGIFCDSRTGGARAQEALESLGADLTLGVTRVPMWRNPHPFDLAALASLTGLCRKHRPNVLHGHGSKGGAYARTVVLPWQERTTVRAYTPHGGSFNFHPGSMLHRIYMAAETIFEKRTDVFLFESSYIADRFDAYVGETEAAVRIIHNGIEEAEFEPIEHKPHPFDLVYVGELREAKGIGTLIDAVARLRNEHQLHLSMLIVGSGPSEAELHAQAKSVGIWESVTFAPPQPIRQALACGRIMTIPSHAESLPYVILEAAAARQPLVSTNVGGIPEIFGPYAEELVPPNDVGALAQAILNKHNETEAERGRKAARLSDFVHSRFSLPKMVDGVIEGYESAFAAKRVTVS